MFLSCFRLAQIKKIQKQTNKQMNKHVFRFKNTTRYFVSFVGELVAHRCGARQNKGPALHGGHAEIIFFNRTLCAHMNLFQIKASCVCSTMFTWK